MRKGANHSASWFTRTDIMTRPLLREFASFAFVGLLNTCVHLAILVSLVEERIFSSSLANVVAFLAASVFSYGLNSVMTFRKRLAWAQYLSFLMCSAVGAVLSFLMSKGAELMHWNYLAGFLLTVSLMPPVNFWLVRRFVFTYDKKSASGRRRSNAHGHR